MKALVWDGSHLAVADRAEPRADAATAVVRVSSAGICNTDLELVKGYMDFRGVLGHEFVGTVLDGPNDWRGKRVVGEINFGCGACARCRSGLARHCAERRVMGILGADGAFAEQLAVPVANLHAVPDRIDDDAAVFVEPLAAAYEILDQVHTVSGSEAVVLGDGKLGLLVAQVLDQAGARVLAVGRHPEKLSILSRRGIRTVTDDRWKREPADLVVEATGAADAFARAIEVTRPRGTLVLKSTVAAEARLRLAPLVINEITVVGSRCGRFAPALDGLARRAVDVGSLVSGRRPLADAVEAFADAARRGAGKILLDCS
jgi:threonine dehydrogenase-like Zn-dependent dehydrogenase